MLIYVYKILHKNVSIDQLIIHDQIIIFVGDWNPIENAGSRADSFEYVMHGKIYRIEGEDNVTDTSVSRTHIILMICLINNE